MPLFNVQSKKNPTGSQFSLLHEPNKKVYGKTKKKTIQQSPWTQSDEWGGVLWWECHSLTTETITNQRKNTIKYIGPPIMEQTITFHTRIHIIIKVLCHELKWKLLPTPTYVGRRG